MLQPKSQTAEHNTLKILETTNLNNQELLADGIPNGSGRSPRIPNCQNIQIQSQHKTNYSISDANGKNTFARPTPHGHTAPRVFELHNPEAYFPTKQGEVRLGWSKVCRKFAQNRLS